MTTKAARIKHEPRTNYCWVFKIENDWFQQIGSGTAFPSDFSKLEHVLSLNFAPPDHYNERTGKWRFNQSFYEQKIRKKLSLSNKIEYSVRYLVLTNFGTAFTFKGARKPPNYEDKKP